MRALILRIRLIFVDHDVMILLQIVFLDQLIMMYEALWINM